MGQRKKSESLTRIEPVTSRTSVGRSNCRATVRLVVSMVKFTTFVLRGILHTAWISNVESNVCALSKSRQGHQRKEVKEMGQEEVARVRDRQKVKVIKSMD